MNQSKPATMNQTVKTETATIYYGYRDDPETIPDSWAEHGGHAPCGYEPAYEGEDARAYYAVEVAVQDRHIIDYSQGIGENADTREECVIIVRYVSADGTDALFREFTAAEQNGSIVPRIVAESGPEHWPAVLSLSEEMADAFDSAPSFDERDVALIERLYGAPKMEAF